MMALQERRQQQPNQCAPPDWDIMAVAGCMLTSLTLQIEDIRPCTRAWKILNYQTLLYPASQDRRSCPSPQLLLNNQDLCATHSVTNTTCHHQLPLFNCDGTTTRRYLVYQPEGRKESFNS